MINPTFQEDENFYSFVFSNGFVYDIPKQMIQTNDQVNEWLLHLQQKNWFTKSVEREFISSVAFAVKK